MAVLSGKGGTGKTSVAASFGFLAGKRAVLCDCDVDAANMPILCSKETISSEDYSGGKIAVIDDASCNDCGKCAAVCRFRAIVIRNGRHAVEMNTCEGCAYCVRVCPVQAVSLRAMKSGEVFLSESRFGGYLVHAELDTGAENSGKLSSRVRQIGDEKARENECSLVIIDGPPGISCPAIAASAGTDYVLFVAEPSLSGLSDFIRVAELVAKMKIPAGVIVNKADINGDIAEQIRKTASEKGLEDLGRIPWSDDFIKAMRKRRTITEYAADSSAALAIVSAWEQIIGKLGVIL